ncbi:hypothetical protein [Aurantibacillus circumpalustris]|uniref:hypothetical protein n=1 Tax=Aurantibacillus circumpalustris TaxID=3036359 RepID=UPI00295B1A62|nr:hypothetical protein [Aurantibacillus circumpalustris]
MSFNGNESSAISLAVATEMTSDYRTNNPNETKAHFFGKNKLMDILNQNGCVGIRAYYGIDADGNKQLVFVGADADEKDLYSGVILDMSAPCPSNCDNTSPLNG